jgi:hypothetical protein
MNRVHTQQVCRESFRAVMAQELAPAAMSAALSLLREQNKNKRPTCWWMRQLFAGRHRHGLDPLDTLKLEDGFGFRNFMRMAPTDFECLLNVIGGKISKENTKLSVVHTMKTRSVLTHWLLRCPPNTSTPQMLRNVVSMNPIADGTQGTFI